MSVLVTGATGFVGSHVVARLRAAGRPVKAFVRDPKKAAELLGAEVATAQGDIRDVASVRAALRDVEAVVHLAAQMSGDLAAHRASAAAAGIVARAAAEAGVERFVHMSTRAVYRDLFGKPDESAAVGPRARYGRGKLEAEREVVASAGVMPYVILRPPMVYGDGRFRSDWTRMLRRVLGRLRVLPLPLGGDFELAFVHVETLAEACVAALRAPRGGTTLNVCDARTVRLREVLATHRELTGRGPRVLALPAALIDALGWVPGLRDEPPFGARVRAGISLDGSRAPRELGIDTGGHDFLDSFRGVLARRG